MLREFKLKKSHINWNHTSRCCKNMKCFHDIDSTVLESKHTCMPNYTCNPICRIINLCSSWGGPKRILKKKTRSQEGDLHLAFPVFFRFLLSSLPLPTPEVPRNNSPCFFLSQCKKNNDNNPTKGRKCISNTLSCLHYNINTHTHQ